LSQSFVVGHDTLKILAKADRRGAVDGIKRAQDDGIEFRSEIAYRRRDSHEVDGLKHHASLKSAGGTVMPHGSQELDTHEVAGDEFTTVQPRAKGSGLGFRNDELHGG